MWSVCLKSGIYICHSILAFFPLISPNKVSSRSKISSEERICVQNPNCRLLMCPLLPPYSKTHKAPAVPKVFANKSMYNKTPSLHSDVSFPFAVFKNLNRFGCSKILPTKNTCAPESYPSLLMCLLFSPSRTLTPTYSSSSPSTSRPPISSTPPWPPYNSPHTLPGPPETTVPPRDASPRTRVPARTNPRPCLRLVWMRS
jgi:hypothetical protein